MAKALSFDQIADQTYDDIKAPPLPPVGEYIFMIMKPPETTELSTDKFTGQRLAFQLKTVSAMDTVDPEALQEYGDLKNMRMQHAFILDTTDKTAFETTVANIKRFLGDHVKCFAPGMSLKEALSASVNQVFMGTVQWRPDKRDESGGTFQAQITKTAPAE